MNFSRILAFAFAEARLARRLVRYWIFVVIAAIFFLGLYARDSLLHWLFSAFSGTAAMMNVRYWGPIYGMMFLAAFTIGVVLLGFDLRNRDVRERISEVIDSRPATNLELVLGRFLGLLFISWVPFTLICIVVYATGLITGEQVLTQTIVNYVLFMGVPALAFGIGLTFLIAVLVKYRILTAILTVAILLSLFLSGVMLKIPVYIANTIGNWTGQFILGYASDFSIYGAGIWGFAQRAGILFLGIAMAALAATLYPRADGQRRSFPLTVGAAVGALAILLLAGHMWFNGIKPVRDSDRWLAAHQARVEQPAPDLVAMDADVSVDAGSSIAIDTTLRFRAPAGASLDSALFTLNPGYDVSRVDDDGGNPLPFSFTDGLLEVELGSPLAGDTERSIRVVADGVPDPMFAYLDARLNPLKAVGQEGNLFLLGFVSLDFNRNYIALTPGTRWLPVSGVDVNRGDPRVSPTDYFDLDMRVELPDGWLAAGPGRRTDGAQAPAGRVRYRFAPPAPLPGAALVAGRYVSRATEIGGITFEVLFHPRHEPALEYFADTADELETWIGERLREADDLGLSYPYDGFTLVEVSAAFRGYGGGWRMDTTMTPPAMALVRESSLPTARFDRHFEDEDRFKDKEGGVPRAKREWLERFFETDFTGGNLFAAVARNVFSYQTSASGPGGLGLDYACEVLASELITGKRTYFSAHLFAGNFGQDVQNSISQMFISGQTDDPGNAIVDALVSRPAVWDEALEVPMIDLDPSEDPRDALDVLTLKGTGMARSLLHQLGAKQIALVLSTLRERFQGENFTLEDVMAVGEETTPGFANTMTLWMQQTALPGFVVERAEAYRLADEDDGSARYQLLVTVRNDEPVAGPVRFSYGHTEDGNTKTEHGDPFSIAGLGKVEVGVVTPYKPISAALRPYLSHNRGAFQIGLPTIDDEGRVDSPPFAGVRTIEYSLPTDGIVVVDDLDDGFAIENVTDRKGLRLGRKNDDDIETDAGLPVTIQWRASTWSRINNASSYGKYRHTAATMRKGKGATRAVFAADLPAAGAWELELHVPSWRGAKDGSWNFKVIDDSGENEVQYVIADGQPGWNSLGIFDMAPGEVRVELSDETDARAVIADAVRWIPPRNNGAQTTATAGGQK